MAGSVILVDTSVLIDYFRKKDKSRTMLWQLFKDGYGMSISVITEYEIMIGATEQQQAFWDQLLRHLAILPLRSAEVRTSVIIQAAMKRKRKQLSIPDLFIAATAVEAKLPIATLNAKHFVHVPGLSVDGV
ncbi:MAG: type II toxin-antitoxin system VapC family toxin [Flavobacteriales bacterium]